MARNEEKAQSMLYRFREAQAAELGLARKGDKRPRMASMCKSLRDCERWRGEILREISRKVSKIQDPGLTDYEIRDLNDEINKLMREKRHWENQIIALGGANYRRNVAMLDEEGKEVPGTRGYKYFGRAKELPGVKELFQKSTEVPEEEQAFTYYKKFLHQGQDYYGDLDEADEQLLAYEKEAEEAEWTSAYKQLAATLGLPDDTLVPKIPRPDPIPLNSQSGSVAVVDDDVEMDGEKSQKSNQVRLPPSLAFLSPEELAQPSMPTKSEMEDVLLQIRKRALLEEYLGNEAPA
ncbi:NineTeen Complex (NTC) component [Tulasnella sp. 419]|nr:NineTeen Complex (NTC) component [Tulasnella sp. 419]